MDEIGTVRMEQEWDAINGQRTRITHADPRTRVSAEVIDDIRSGRSDGLFVRPYAVLDGDVLTISDDYGQRFIYRIRWDDYADGGYLAEWPD